MKLMSIGWFDEMSNKQMVVVVTHVCCCRDGTSERWRLSACGACAGACAGAPASGVGPTSSELWAVSH